MVFTNAKEKASSKRDVPTSAKLLREREKNDWFLEMQASGLDVEPSKVVGRMKNLSVSPSVVTNSQVCSVRGLPGN